MKTNLAILFTALAFTSGAFADQPTARVIHDSKGNVLAVAPSSPSVAMPIAMAKPRSATCKTCALACAR